MSEWRIVEHSEQAFEVQRKGLFFWGSCHSAAMGMGSMPLFRSLDEAKAFIVRQKLTPRVVHEE